MTIKDVAVVLLLVAMAGGIVWYLIRAKKRGETCVGCPHAKQCSGNCGDKAKNNE